MQTISQIMTRNVQTVAPGDNLQRTAQLMGELNVGAIPVCDDGKLVGIITDRDIAVRATAAGKSPQQAHVDEIMSTDVQWCYEDQSMDDVMTQMADSRIRRIPVVSHDDQHNLVGIVSLGDVVTKAAGQAAQKDAEDVVLEVSTPSRPERSGSNQAKGNGQKIYGSKASHTQEVAGLDLPNAGQAGINGIGVAGASGDPGTSTADATGQARRNYGVSGEDLTRDGLPPH